MKKNRTREERALRYAAVLLRLTVLLWIAVLLLCLLEPGCLAMDAAAAAAETDPAVTWLAAAAAETDPAVTWLAAVGAGWLTWRGMVLVLKLDEPRRKRTRRR
ncbi:MAG: hypothetical protein ACLS74_00955 [Oscillibacter sp.]|jgi:hypothetical protein